MSHAMWALRFYILPFVLEEIQAAGFLLDHEKAEVTYFNKDYISNPMVKLFHFNKTSKAYNVSTTLVQDLPMNLKVGLQIFKRQENGYRTVAPQFAPNFCDMLSRNDFGLRGIFKYGNITDCPLKKNSYHVSNFMIDAGSLPPHFLIPGNYKITGRVFSKPVNFVNFNIFASITPTK